MQSEPLSARTQVWPPSISLAATLEIDVSFFSSGYLDVSVHRVPFHTLWIGVWILEVCSSRFPHSDISGSQDICSSPKLFAAYHVFHRLLVPRHPPYALSCLTFYFRARSSCPPVLVLSWFFLFFFLIVNEIELVFCSYSSFDKFERIKRIFDVFFNV